jgi:hypothetical protein
MTPFEKQQLQQLIWKEGRQVGGVLGLAVGINVFAASLPLWTEVSWLDALTTGPVCALFIASFGLGVVSYGLELNDHTQAYLTTRPIAHWKVFLIKLLWTLIPISLLALLTGICWEGSSHQGPGSHERPLEFGFWILFPLVPLSIEFVILLIRPMIPSLIFAISVGIGFLWLLRFNPWWLALLFGCLFLVGNFYMSRYRMRGEGW